MNASDSSPRLSWWCLLALFPVIGFLVGLGDILWFDNGRGHGTLLVSLASFLLLWGSVLLVIVAFGLST